MPVITQYAVFYKGKEVFVTPDKKAADAYDKMLDTAEQLSALIGARSGVTLSEADLETLSIFLAKNREPVTALLKGKSFQDIQSELITDPQNVAD